MPTKFRVPAIFTLGFMTLAMQASHGRLEGSRVTYMEHDEMANPAASVQTHMTLDHTEQVFAGL